MDDEAAKTKRPRRSTKPPLTLEGAEGQILDKLQKAGPGGTAAPYSKTKGSSAEGPLYAQALASLASEERREIFRDQRGKTPKYYLWIHRPKLPTAEAVAEKILAFAQSEHPRIYHEAGLVKRLKPGKDEKPLFPAALRLLCEGGQLTAMDYAPAAKTTRLYAVTAAFQSPARPAAPAAAPVSERPLSPDDVRPAYDALVRQSGFPAVPIATLQKAAGVAMEPLKDLLRRERDNGGVVLSIGDWSIASEEERAGVIEMHGRKYLQVRWQL